MIRASFLPIASVCAASTADGMRVQPAHPAADVGTCVHSVLTQTTRAGRDWVDDDAARTLAMNDGLDQDEVARLSHWGWKAWRELREWFPAPLDTEKYFEHGQLCGHLDVLAYAEKEARLLDYKTGRVDVDHTPQMKGYAWLVLQENPELESAYATVVRVRDFSVDAWRWSRGELDQWYQALQAHLATVDTYRPGPQCTYCPRGFDCPAKNALVRQAAQAVMDPESYSLLGLANLPENPVERGTVLGMLLDRIKLVESTCEHARALIKSDVLSHGGVLPTGDDRELVVIEQERQEIVAAEAWPVLEAALPLEKLLLALEVSKDKLKKQVSAQARRGEKGKAIEELMKRLDEQGAIVRKTIPRLEVRQCRPAITGPAA